MDKFKTEITRYDMKNKKLDRFENDSKCDVT